jgi:hypothetical protein
MCKVCSARTVSSPCYEANLVPPPSSDRSKWWLDNHSQAKSDMKVPTGSRLNPNRPVNPWKENGEPNFIDKARPLVARKPVTLNSDIPPPLPTRASTMSAVPPMLPDRAKSVNSRHSSISSRKSSVAPPIPPQRGQEAAETTIAAQVKHEVDHLNDDNGSEASSLSGYKSLV